MNLNCPCCGEGGYHANERWFDDHGNAFDDYDDMLAYGQFDEEEDS